MKLRLFPRHEDAYFGLFQAGAETIAAATVLLDLLIDLADPETKQLAELEHQGDPITRTILTRLASTFIARLDRDDIFELAERLDNVTDGAPGPAHAALKDITDGIEQALDELAQLPTPSKASSSSTPKQVAGSSVRNPVCCQVGFDGSVAGASRLSRCTSCFSSKPNSRW